MHHQLTVVHVMNFGFSELLTFSSIQRICPTLGAFLVMTHSTESKKPRPQGRIKESFIKVMTLNTKGMTLRSW